MINIFKYFKQPYIPAMRKGILATVVVNGVPAAHIIPNEVTTAIMAAN